VQWAAMIMTDRGTSAFPLDQAARESGMTGRKVMNAQAGFRAGWLVNDGVAMCVNLKMRFQVQ